MKTVLVREEILRKPLHHSTIEISNNDFHRFHSQPPITSFSKGGITPTHGLSDPPFSTSSRIKNKIRLSCVWCRRQQFHPGWRESSGHCHKPACQPSFPCK